jgi:hypothetical protein
MRRRVILATLIRHIVARTGAVTVEVFAARVAGVLGEPASSPANTQVKKRRWLKAPDLAALRKLHYTRTCGALPWPWAKSLTLGHLPEGSGRETAHFVLTFANHVAAKPKI